MVFLSTLSLRRATRRPSALECTRWYFYPRSPCGERPYVTNVFMLVWKFLSTLSLRRATGKSTTLTRIAWISIHALLAESDCYSFRHSAQGRHFYPRSPCGERRVHFDNFNLHCVISIHALLAESDPPSATLSNGKVYFYPRSPCGERLIQAMAHLTALLFLSTLSLRRATMTSLLVSMSC